MENRKSKAKSRKSKDRGEVVIREIRLSSYRYIERRRASGTETPATKMPDTGPREAERRATPPDLPSREEKKLSIQTPPDLPSREEKSKRDRNSGNRDAGHRTTRQDKIKQNKTR